MLQFPHRGNDCEVYCTVFLNGVDLRKSRHKDRVPHV